MAEGPGGLVAAQEIRTPAETYAMALLPNGELLCASDEAHTTVEPLTPPEGAACGERITFEGFAGEPEKQINPKKKLLEKLFPDLVTNAEGTAMYKQAAFMTSKGPCTASLKNGLVR